MQLPISRARQCLQRFDFETLFIEEMGWDNYHGRLEVVVDGEVYRLIGIAEKRGFVALHCTESVDGRFPDYATRRAIERQVGKSVHQHLIIFTDSAQTRQIWQWVRREWGKPAACREHVYYPSQPGDSLLQKLQAIAFSLEEEEGLTQVDVVSGVIAAFDVERVTKRFYDRFKDEHRRFLGFIEGIVSAEDREWYASVMLNRLMFVYFIQKKGFLDGDVDYLRHRLRMVQERRGRDHFLSFYRHFLLRLFHEGLGRQETTAELDELLGRVPYLNGGIFLPHPVEERHPDIDIPDEAFERLFDFFEQYQWRLDERPLRADNEINPDVLGYIFEKYVNQKQMGAYYTKEDITEYIGRSTIIPFLLDRAAELCPAAFVGERAVWQLLAEDPDRYLYEAVRRGVVLRDGSIFPESALPDFVQAGMRDPRARMFERRYNLGQAVLPGPDGGNLALPTETWREYIARRQRCLELRERLRRGEVRSANDLITYNLDLRQFAQDVIETAEDPDLLRAFWEAIRSVTVLDPTCGSGAFLFAALNILEPLYDACLERMEAFLAADAAACPDFRQVLQRIAQHPNRRYFVLKSIIVHNLFGVDIMEEAVEICKLRLFLKLVAQVEQVADIEPLPDIDFNIRAGNTLVGYATYDDVKRAVGSRLDFDDVMERIEAKAAAVDDLFSSFRVLQMDAGAEEGIVAAVKSDLRRGLGELREELNRYLAGEYGVQLPSPAGRGAGGEGQAYAQWLASHQPFHWFVEFYGILKRGGFDVIIGNLPYLELRALTDYSVRGLDTISTRNLFSLVLERCDWLSLSNGRQGYIVPVASVATEGYSALQAILSRRRLHYSCYDDRPAHLFQDLDKNTLSILILADRISQPHAFASRLCRWRAEERDSLFQLLQYHEAPAPRLQGCMAKIGSPTEAWIWDRLFQVGKPVAAFYAPGAAHVVHYSRKVNAFLQILDFIPEVRDGRGRLRPPSEFKTLVFRNETHARAALCLFNSSLFRWFVDAVSDGSHLNRREVDNFPFDLERAEDRAGALPTLAHRLSGNLRATSETRTMRYQHDTLTVQCIVPKASKPILDEIDCLLARHYGFTDEELDFIINYDIKYRMGG